jgi:hypothetical protein
MIEWPHGDQAVGDAKKALDSFRKSGLAAELEEDSQKWRFRAFARSAAPPARMVLRSDGSETRIFSLEPTGYWCRIVDQDVVA